MTDAEVKAREAIRHTMACYTMAGDRLQTDKFLDVFTEDAVLETDGVPAQDAFRYTGRQAIGDWMNRWRDLPRTAGRSAHQATFVRHHLATCLIEFIDDDTARTRTYWTAYTDIGPDHCGCYLDVFRQVGARWLIAHRKIRLDWRSPDSRMFSAIASTQ
jgi:hypothetical protein